MILEEPGWSLERRAQITNKGDYPWRRIAQILDDQTGHLIDLVYSKWHSVPSLAVLAERSLPSSDRTMRGSSVVDYTMYRRRSEVDVEATIIHYMSNQAYCQ